MPRRDLTAFLIHWPPPLLLATLAAGAWGSVIQTHRHLAALLALGVAVPLDVRVEATLTDLVRFGPVMAAIAGAALLPALPLAAWLAGARPRWQQIALFVGVGFVALWCALAVMTLVTPMPSLIFAARGWQGQAMVATAGAAGGLAFALLMAPSARWRRPRSIAAAALLVPAVGFAAMSPAADPAVPAHDPASYRVETLARGLDRPWAVAALPDGRLLVTQLGGRLRAVATDGRVSDIDVRMLPAILHDGGGLMDLALDPGFAATGLIYLTLTDGEPAANGTAIVRARLAGDRLIEPRVLYRSTRKSSDSNHGSRLAFLADGTLVATMGDGNDRREQAQHSGNSFGKIVRIGRDGRVPSDNPFPGSPVYSLGHRNPQGIALAPGGALLMSDHGPRGGDELNRITPGSNHGWPVAVQGIDYSFALVTPYRRLPGYIDPLVAWSPSPAPAGLAVYTGTCFADWRGDLLVPMLRERTIRHLKLDRGRVVAQYTLLGELDERIRDVRVARDGALLVLTDGPDARLLRVTPA